MWLTTVLVILSLYAFVGGLRVMRAGLEGMAGGRLSVILSRFVKTPTRGIITGAIVTALVQSSAAITAISVGMVAGGTMMFRDALGVVLGSNVGSSITPQIMTLNMWGLVVPCLVVGILMFLSRQPKLRHTSMALVGFSTIFIGLKCLTTALHPLAGTPWFTDVLKTTGGNPLLSVGAGIIASAAVQSSTATTIIAMALANQHVIPLQGAIGIVLGANIGTCLTSIIAAFGQSRSAQQVALSHVLLNVGGVVLLLPFLVPYTGFIKSLSTNPTQQVANAHTVFNVLCTLLVWPVTDKFANLIERLLPSNRDT